MFGSSGEGVSALALMGMEDPPLPVHLHPLVILNVTHHMTRMQQCVRNNAEMAAFGILLGWMTKDGDTEIANSYEAVITEMTPTGDLHINWEAVKLKRGRLAEVQPELNVLGYYSVGSTMEDVIRCISVMHIKLCETFDDIDNGTVLALMVGWTPQTELASLPVHLFEVVLLHDHEQQRQHAMAEQKSELRPPQEDRQGAYRMQRSAYSTDAISSALSSNRCIVSAIRGASCLMVQLTKIRFLLDPDEVMQIGVDAATNSTHSDAAVVTVAPKIHCLVQSLKLLRQRILLVVEYLKAVESGCIRTPDPDLMRRLTNVCAMLPKTLHATAPSTDDTKLYNAIREEVQQSLALALLSMQTKCNIELGEVVKALKRSTTFR